MRVYIAFLPMDADSLEDSWINRMVGRIAREDGAMVHAEIVFREDEDDLYSKSASIHYGKDVFCRDKLFGRPGWRFLGLNMSPEEARRCLEWCQGQVGKGFNYYGFWTQPIPCTGGYTGDKFFCSELVCACLRENGIRDIPTMSPHELYKYLLKSGSIGANPKIRHLELSWVPT